MTGFANEMSPASASSGPDSAAATADATVEPRPTHLLTMSRGAPEAVPASAMRVLRAMGVEAIMMPGQGVGLTFRREIPNFLRLDPFRLTDLAPVPAPEEEAEIVPDDPGLVAGVSDEADETAPAGDAVETAGMADEVVPDAAPEDEPSDSGDAMPEDAADEPAFEAAITEDEASVLEAMAEEEFPDVPGVPETELRTPPDTMSETGDEAVSGLAGLPDETGPGPDIAPEDDAATGAEPPLSDNIAPEADDLLPDMSEAETEAGEDQPAADGSDSTAEDEFPDHTGEPDEAAAETFGAALDRVMDRLDLIEFMLGNPRDDQADADPGESLGTRISTIEAAMTRIEDRQQRLAEGLERVEAAVERIETALYALAQSSSAPTDDADSSEAAIEAIEQRIEAIAERLGEVQSSHSGEIADLLERIERLAEAQPEGSVSGDDIAARAIEIDALSSLVTALSEQLMAGHGAERKDNLDAVLDRLNATQESIAAMVSQLLEGRPVAERRFGA
ncbi:hypothetical protein [Rhodovulum sp. YEN HP10]|uniref:hypothetical protein n=1 Tax=Rhodovulum sp. HP10 TaxID=3387397 RepID=UPI0039E0BEFB